MYKLYNSYTDKVYSFRTKKNIQNFLNWKPNKLLNTVSRSQFEKGGGAFSNEKKTNRNISNNFLTMAKGYPAEYKVLVYNELPKGCRYIKGALTAPNGYQWADNGKGFFSKGHKQFLVRDKKSKF